MAKGDLRVQVPIPLRQWQALRLEAARQGKKTGPLLYEWVRDRLEAVTAEPMPDLIEPACSACHPPHGRQQRESASEC